MHVTHKNVKSVIGRTNQNYVPDPVIGAVKVCTSLTFRPEGEQSAEALQNPRLPWRMLPLTRMGGDANDCTRGTAVVTDACVMPTVFFVRGRG